MGRSRGVQEERAEHTKTFRRTLAGFRLAGHQKVRFSTFDGKLESKCIRNGIQNPPYCPGSLQDTFIIYSSISHQHIFPTYFPPKKHLENRKSENLKFQKPRFTNKCPVKGELPLSMVPKPRIQWKTEEVGNLASYCCKIFLKIMLVRYRGMNNKGVLERPWTIWRVLIAISGTLKFQSTVKC